MTLSQRFPSTPLQSLAIPGELAFECLCPWGELDLSLICQGRKNIADGDRKLHIMLEDMVSDPILSGDVSTRTYFLHYTTPAAHISTRYYIKTADLLFTKDSRRRKVSIIKKVLVPQLELSRDLASIVSKSLGRPMLTDGIAPIIADIKEAFLLQGRFLHGNPTEIPEPEVIFFSEDLNLAEILDQLNIS